MWKKDWFFKKDFKHWLWIVQPKGNTELSGQMAAIATFMDR